MERLLVIGVAALCAVAALLPQNALATPTPTIDRSERQEVVGYIEANPTLMDSVVVYHNGRTVMKEYFADYSGLSPHDIQSATKSITSALVGIAIDRGIIESVDQPVMDLLPEKYAYLFTGGRENITVRMLLTMTSGLEWVDFGPDSSFARLFAAPDSVAFILGEPLVTTPGAEFYYNSGSSHLLSAIIHHQSGMTTQEFAQKYLFDPLGIKEKDYRWDAHADGVAFGGWGLWMRPVDMLEFGKLYLREGRISDGHGQRQDANAAVLAAQWVSDSFQPWVAAGPYSYYGYQWWKPTYFIGLGGAQLDVAHAAGWGGQSIYVVDGLGLVIVTTAKVTLDSNSYYPYAVADMLIKAAQD